MDKKEKKIDAEKGGERRREWKTGGREKHRRNSWAVLYTHFHMTNPSIPTMLDTYYALLVNNINNSTLSECVHIKKDS